jgi:acid stress chaperone HdeB
LTNPKSIVAGIVAGMLFCLVAVAPARAQVTLDVSKITCVEFLHDTITVPDNIAYWLSGYYNAKRHNTVFDVNVLKSYVSKVQDYCLHHEDMTVMKAAETLLNIGK